MKSQVTKKAKAQPSVHAAKTPAVQAAQAPAVQAAQAPAVQAVQAPAVQAVQAPAVQAAQAPAVQAAETPNRIELKEKGFSIVPPTGWEVNTRIANLSLLMQMPRQAGVYQRTIQVAHGSQQYAVTGSGGEESVAAIVAKRAKATAVVEDYLLRNQQPLTLANGQQAVLFYTEFHIGNVPMMEMHLLTGDRTGHFLVTYTDVAENFNMDTHRGIMNEVYNSLVSIQVAQPPAPQYMNFSSLGVAAVIVFAGFLLVTIVRRRAGAILLHLDSPIVSDLPRTAEDEELDTPLSTMDAQDDDESELYLKKTKVYQGKLDLASLKKDGTTSSDALSLQGISEAEGMTPVSEASPSFPALSLDLANLDDDDDIVDFKFPAKKAKRVKEVPVKVKK